MDITVEKSVSNLVDIKVVNGKDGIKILINKKPKKYKSIVNWKKVLEDNPRAFRGLDDNGELISGYAGIPFFIIISLISDEELKNKKTVSVLEMLEHLKSDLDEPINENYGINLNYQNVYQGMRKLCRLAGVPWNGRIPVSMPN